MPEPTDQPLPGFAAPSGPPLSPGFMGSTGFMESAVSTGSTGSTGSTVVLERSKSATRREASDGNLAAVVALRMRPARGPDTVTLEAPPAALVRRPGAVGCVTVRAPLLDPTRSAPAQVPGRPLASTSGRRPAITRRAPPHPRLVDRQHAIRRAERMARLRPLLIPVLLLVALTVGALTILTSPLFSVSRVVLRFNGTPAEQQEIGGLIAPMRNRNLVRLNVGSREAALRSLPWVASATVRRSFPRTVEVRVTAHDVVGAVRLPNGRVAMTSTDGSVLSVVDADDPSVVGLPSFDLGLTAIPTPNDALADPAPAVLASAKALERRLPGRLLRVVLGEGGVEWILKPTDGGAPARVLIGRPRDSDVPAAALVSVLSRFGPTPNVIDLRSPDTPVLTFPASR